MISMPTFDATANVITQPSNKTTGGMGFTSASLVSNSPNPVISTRSTPSPQLSYALAPSFFKVSTSPGFRQADSPPVLQAQHSPTFIIKPNSPAATTTVTLTDGALVQPPRDTLTPPMLQVQIPTSKDNTAHWVIRSTSPLLGLTPPAYITGNAVNQVFSLPASPVTSDGSSVGCLTPPPQLPIPKPSPEIRRRTKAPTRTRDLPPPSNARSMDVDHLYEKYQRLSNSGQLGIFWLEDGYTGQREVPINITVSKNPKTKYPISATLFSFLVKKKHFLESPLTPYTAATVHCDENGPKPKAKTKKERKPG